MKTLEEFNAHYKAVRERLNNPPIIKKVTVAKLIEPGLVLVFPTPPPPPEPKVALIRNKFGENVVTINDIGCNAQRILREVAEKYDMPMSVYKTPSRKKMFIICRQEAAFRLSTEAHFSLGRIGRFFGHQDHTTVLNSINRYKMRMANGWHIWAKPKKDRTK